MTRRDVLFLTAAALALGSPECAPAAIRAIFVGIDTYQFSSAKYDESHFIDLQGAVGDTLRIKDALRKAYKLDLDVSTKDTCKTQNAVSISLNNSCATRKAILDALNAAIAAAVKGDTVLFYFAGHGSQTPDLYRKTKATGMNGTFLAYDARNPEAPAEADIVDVELQNVAARTEAKGANFVLIADSCHSASMTRALHTTGQSKGVGRIAPKLAVPPPQKNFAKILLPVDHGYQAELAAADDSEIAYESAIDRAGTKGGVFTAALAKTMVDFPDMNLADLMAETRSRMILDGHVSQHPQADGEVSARLGEKAAPHAVIVDAVANGSEVTLSDGSASGMTVGSAFALFPNTTLANTSGAHPLATGHIITVDPSRATLMLDQPPSAKLTPQLYARETQHVYPPELLRVANLAAIPAVHQKINQALALPFVKILPEGQFAFTTSGNEKDGLLMAHDGTIIAKFPDLNSPGFPTDLAAALTKIAHVETLLSNRVIEAHADILTCIGSNDYDIYGCQGSTLKPGDFGKLRQNQPAKLTAANSSVENRYLYVFGIDDDYRVQQLLPIHGGHDRAVDGGFVFNTHFTPAAEGYCLLVSVATDAPINPADFVQAGISGDAPSSCGNASEVAGSLRAIGARDFATRTVTRMTITVTEAKINRAK